MKLAKHNLIKEISRITKIYTVTSWLHLQLLHPNRSSLLKASKSSIFNLIWYIKKTNLALRFVKFCHLANSPVNKVKMYYYLAFFYCNNLKIIFVLFVLFVFYLYLYSIFEANETLAQMRNSVLVIHGSLSVKYCSVFIVPVFGINFQIFWISCYCPNIKISRYHVLCNLSNAVWIWKYIDKVSSSCSRLICRIAVVRYFTKSTT